MLQTLASCAGDMLSALGQGVCVCVGGGSGCFVDVGISSVELQKQTVEQCPLIYHKGATGTNENFKPTGYVSHLSRHTEML